MGKVTKAKTEILPEVEKEDCKIVTAEFRASYPNLFKAQAPKDKSGKESGKPKFSITMLFSKDYELMGADPKTKEAKSFKKAMRNAKILKYGTDKAKWPKNLESPIKDGDDPEYADKEGYAGHWVIKASCSEERRPQVLDHKKNPITEVSDFPPGCYARAILYARVWEFMNKQGVQFILDGVQKSNRDYETFGGRQSASDVFEPWSVVEDDSTDDDDDDSDEDGEDL